MERRSRLELVVAASAVLISLLDECWITDFEAESEPVPVALCPSAPGADWAG